MNIKKQPVNVVSIEYNQTGNSVCTNSMGMREMQQRVYKQRHSKYLLIKAPPASGKSRALMFVGLDKLFNQNRRKIIVSVPERSIGASFETTALKSHGFLLIGKLTIRIICALLVLKKAKLKHLWHL